MSPNQPINLSAVISLAPVKVSMTWLMVIIENIMLMLLPLFLGYAIDDVLNQSTERVVSFAALLLGLVVVGVLRRFYDTRAYGDIRVRLAHKVEQNLRSAPISTKNARLTMSRELVDFLEEDLPTLMTALVQLVATVLILATFHLYFALSVLSAGILMLLLYSLFHQTFTTLNGELNDQLEQQVSILGSLSLSAIRNHFVQLKRCEIKLSDTEALVYGLIFTLLFAALLGNLMMISLLNSPTTGQVFSIFSYSLEFVESAVMLPVALQTLSRLEEISSRLNQTSSISTLKEELNEAQ
ncbi:ABC transporter six-transmembrane domain-containing protein [Pleionea sp. CnH1-48]|uniref:ABC transporter six-transmembrane domain-containing protein n=1 Tax=Pleionea sp. CnH1-48 TaxID=2954494 RepID=UPI0020968F55|nr:ABC transporter six-transmembrane domain-containing protein [Pleionea sp. CnH1-48]MCO7224581.1 ABC transporter six-transmembrane domain-containing protein [Pleionea sp. CnH1-48]